MKVILRILVVIFVVASTGACSVVFGRTVTLEVVDSDDAPVPEAKVVMGFLHHTDETWKDALTNEQGIVKLRGNDRHGVKTVVSKDGYYRSERRIIEEGSIETVIRVKEKKNPIPMYVKKVGLTFLAENTRRGFDLKKGDWLPPWGDGESAHVYFSFKGDARSLFDKEATLKIDFPNDEGGLVKLTNPGGWSKYKFPYKAPESGYKNKIVHTLKRRRISENETSYDSTLDRSALGYAFKVVVDASNGEKKVFYGKIKDEFMFSPYEEGERDGVGFVRFTYYFNPNPGDRNIEFDPQRNLFKDAEKTYPP